jgi:hypothetical protein
VKGAARLAVDGVTRLAVTMGCSYSYMYSNIDRNGDVSTDRIVKYVLEEREEFPHPFIVSVCRRRCCCCRRWEGRDWRRLWRGTVGGGGERGVIGGGGERGVIGGGGGRGAMTGTGRGERRAGSSGGPRECPRESGMESHVYCYIYLMGRGGGGNRMIFLSPPEGASFCASE